MVTENLLYLYRVNGTLRQVHPLTVPSRENNGIRLCKILDTGQIIRARDDELYRYYT